MYLQSAKDICTLNTISTYSYTLATFILRHAEGRLSIRPQMIDQDKVRFETDGQEKVNYMFVNLFLLLPTCS